MVIIYVGQFGVLGVENGFFFMVIFNEFWGLNIGIDGLFFVVDICNNLICCISLEGEVSMLVGMGVYGFIDGIIIQVFFGNFMDLVQIVDGMIYVVDYFMYVICKIIVDGVVSMFVGLGDVLGNMDG